LISWWHYSAAHDPVSHSVLEELYYIPLLLASMKFGLKGAILTYALVSTLYISHIATVWTGTTITLINKLQHLLFSGVFAFLAGFFVDRERKHRKQLEKEQYLAGIGKVATTIVHDLKNPLITILGFAKRIKEKKGNMDNAVQAILDSAENMQRIVDDVLDFAKPARLALEEEDVRIVVSRASQTCLTKAQEKNIKLMSHMPTNPAKTAIDAFQMERALVNLICNAIDASGTGEAINILLSHGQDYLAIRIRDHGVGMDKETIKNMFTPFYSNKNNGTGLGMPIAQKIIEAHQGDIFIDSEPDIGTEVTIKLPYKTS
jgi:signal transduction histidine kinase